MVYSFQDTTFLYLVMEYCAGGELFDALIQTDSGFSEHVAAKVVKQMLAAVCITSNFQSHHHQ